MSWTFSGPHINRHVKDKLRRRLSKEDAQIGDKILDALYHWTAGRKYCVNYPSYDALAQDLDVSREQLGWFFSEVLDTKFMSFRKRQKLAYAAFLMRQDATMPAAAAGQEAGIADKSDFRRQFTEVFKMSPEDWRASSS